MKTKIIYISGSEVFDVADIRAAFEEVRTALGLTPDTVLFGVPVDSDDCSIVTTTDTATAIQSVAEEEKIIPILSVLNTQTDETQKPEIIEDDTEYEIEITANDEITESNSDIETENVCEEITEIITEELLEHIINDDIPESDEEQTLERLLEKMTPLHEDYRKQKSDFEIMPTTDTTSDMLEQLASEFAETQDEIILEKKSDTGGKIGKLKNILPFKKAKREDSGLMGDLFGWAGIAANDDEFSMPDFFSGKVSKK